MTEQAEQIRDTINALAVAARDKTGWLPDYEIMVTTANMNLTSLDQQVAAIPVQSPLAPPDLPAPEPWRGTEPPVDDVVEGEATEIPPQEELDAGNAD